MSDIDPLKLGLISLKTKSSVATLRELVVSDTYLSNGIQFHPDGLYSTAIFGLKGSDERLSRFAYIDLNTEIIIPDVYIQLTKARELYKDIMAGKAYVTFTDENDFEPLALEDGGQTGFTYFIKHVDKLIPPDSGSSSRGRLIDLMDKYRGKLTTRYFLVLPAGYRDMEVSKDGRSESDEVNNLYLNVLRNSRTIISEDITLDPLRFATQKAAVEISQYIDGINFGKTGAINGKFGKRGVRQGTRNVITSQIHEIVNLESASNTGLLDVTMGIVQLTHTYPDKLFYQVKQLLLPILQTGEYDFNGIDPVTKTDVVVPFNQDLYDLMMFNNGFKQLIEIVKIKENRDRKFTHDDKWLGAVYKPPGNYQVVSSVQELPEGYKSEYLFPLTLSEIIYIAAVRIEGQLVGTATRAPVLGEGGIQVNRTKIHFTDEYSERIEIGADGYPTGVKAGRYPSIGGVYSDSFTVSELSIGPFVADFDGDALSRLPITTDEGIEEINTQLTKAWHYKNTTGGLLYGLGGIDVANNVLLTITRQPTK